MTDLCTLSDVKAWISLAGNNGWVKNTSYGLNVQVVPFVNNGYFYRASIAGASGSTEPTWPKTIGTTVTDNTVTWTCAGVTDDLVLARLITAESGVIYQFLNRDTLLTDSYDEFYSGLGYGQTRLFMKHYPISAVTSVTIDGVSIPAKTSVFWSSGFTFDDRSIILNDYEFTKGLNNVEVEYDAGYSAIPSDIAQACIELVALRYRERTRIGENSKSIAGETVNFNTKAMTDSILQSLTTHKRVVSL